jgi:hypothetical protein
VKTKKCLNALPAILIILQLMILFKTRINLFVWCRGVGARVEAGKDCWAYQIEGLTALIKLNNRVTSLEAHALMQVSNPFQRDLLTGIILRVENFKL